MKIFLSSDMEGTAGIVDWSQCRAPGAAYEAGCRLLLGEVNSAIDGALAGGASEILVNDSHGAMANLPPDALAGRCSYLSGRHKPLYMLEGLDGTFAGVFFVSYHGSMGSNGTLSHTYNPRAVGGVRLNDVTAGESALNALVALSYGVPVALITGDQVTIEEAAPFLPGVEGVVVKRSVTGALAAESLHPSVAQQRIAEGSTRAAERLAAGAVPLPTIELPANLDVDWLTADMAEMATWIRGVERSGPRSTAMEGADPLELYRRFVACVALTRSIVES